MPGPVRLLQLSTTLSLAAIIANTLNGVPAAALVILWVIWAVLAGITLRVSLANRR